MAEPTNKNLLLIFIKNPQKGYVKTRLARSIGDDQALKVYRKLLSKTKSVTDRLNIDRQVWYSDFIHNDDLWSNGQYEKRLQSGEDLGERMKDAFRQAFADGYKNVVVIGSDCPSLTSQIVKQTFEALEDKEIVIGPSKDGGYYLLGMSSFYPQLFDDIPWSTSEVLKQTLDQVNELKLSYTLLPKLNDIDTVEDLRGSEIN